MQITRIEGGNGPHKAFNNDRIADFLFQHLDQYGDERKDIMKCLNYVFEKGGSISIAHEGETMKGVVVLNDTGMEGYIPENILVYIAVDASTRGQGVGRKLIEDVQSKTKGSIALHVEPDNPAKKLYERLGFTNKYLEMRWTKAN
ncbi:GNAT family N-acetyltransferase [Algoriphagus sediminis]|uniref:GNAT family N-acetyltransferase n=1 Tax=Algoriphagus sediminis TaxID=3057113 RepID=A0ABT7YB57_9BACT|nr:GNAT family N-acetyltransferase [Algoriphagus sediminis]MDN3203728.1 GNAT family N-acetyltransferase [Algoriphagus sediminis]